MAQLQVHAEKAEMFWRLARAKYDAKATPFICINLVMYTVGHQIEGLLAKQNRHPSSPPRGVPHGDRETLLRRYLVPEGVVDEKWANRYSDLVARRDTFVDGGIPSRNYLEEYMKLAEPLVQYLAERLKIGTQAPH